MEKEQPSSASRFGIIPLYFAILWLVIAAGPFLFQVVTTFKTSGEFSSGGLFQLPKTIQIGNYVSVFSDGLYRFFINSIIVLAVSLTLLLLFSAFASYPLSRMEFKLNKPIYSAIVAAMSIPIHITLIPIFVMTNHFDLYDNMLALIGPNVAFNLPVSVFILTGFMRGISKEMEEAAEIDGCGKFTTFFKILLPLSKPGLATIAIYNGVVIWNEFIFVMTLTGSRNAQTLPMAIWQYQGQYSFDVPKVMTVLVLTSLPMILFYIFGQDKLVKGMMAGAVKG